MSSIKVANSGKTRAKRLCSRYLHRSAATASCQPGAPNATDTHQGRFRFSASASDHGEGARTSGTPQQSARPWPPTSRTLSDSQPVDGWRAHLLGPLGQKHFPMFSRRLRRARQRPRSLGGHPPPAALRRRAPSGGEVPAANEQRRGTRPGSP